MLRLLIQTPDGKQNEMFLSAKAYVRGVKAKLAAEGKTAVEIEESEVGEIADEELLDELRTIMPKLRKIAKNVPDDPKDVKP